MKNTTERIVTVVNHFRTGEIKVFEKDMHQNDKEIEAMNEVDTVLKKQQIYAVYQPICCLGSGEVYGYEGLSRTSNPIFANIVELIETAQMKNKLNELDLLMMEKAICNFTMESKLFVNVESKSKEATIKYMEKMIQVIKKFGISTKNIILELSERERWSSESLLVMKNFAKHYHFLLAIDDFGVGFSNLSLLLELHPDIVKIDRSLVNGINRDIQKSAYIKNFLVFAKRSNLKVLYEGIEEDTEYRVLRNLGGDYGQGYYFGKPK